jgi:hypothetical protein
MRTEKDRSDQMKYLIVLEIKPLLIDEVFNIDKIF